MALLLAMLGPGGEVMDGITLKCTELPNHPWVRAGAATRLELMGAAAAGDAFLRLRGGPFARIVGMRGGHLSLPDRWPRWSRETCRFPETPDWGRSNQIANRSDMIGEQVDGGMTPG
jgi:hypothetical protein